MKNYLIFGLLWIAPMLALAALPPIEIHQSLAAGQPSLSPHVALTLDACGGQFDDDLIRF